MNSTAFQYSIVSYIILLISVCDKNIGNDTKLYVVFLEEVQSVHSRDRMKVVGAINCKIKDIGYECYHWVIYKMFFRDELKPNFISQSNSIGVCNTCLFMCVTNTPSSGKWNDGLNIQVFIFVTAEGVGGCLKIILLIISPLLWPC